MPKVDVTLSTLTEVDVTLSTLTKKMQPNASKHSLWIGSMLQNNDCNHARHFKIA